MTEVEWKPILEAAVSNGIFCVLFCVLFWYVIRQNEERENQLRNLISEYNNQLRQISGTLIKIQEALSHEHN